MRNILFVLFLCFPCVCFGQEYQSVIAPSEYPDRVNGQVIPLNDGQAILTFKSQPRGTFDNITDVRIIPSYSYNTGVSLNGAIGWSEAYGSSGDPNSYVLNFAICDSRYIYTQSTKLSSSLLKKLQTSLVAQNLGTVAQRAALIRSFHSGPVQIIDPSSIYAGFLNLFGPYANIFIGVFLTLFVVDLMTRKTKATVAESAKVARAAERREINQQINNDTTAQIYKYRLSNLAGIKSGRIQDSEISQSQARRMFRETAEEYAEYRRSRGWVY